MIAAQGVSLHALNRLPVRAADDRAGNHRGAGALGTDRLQQLVDADLGDWRRVPVAGGCQDHHQRLLRQIASSFRH
jgi:hypothetical protein